MCWRYGILFLIVGLFLTYACGDNKEIESDIAKSGSIFGTVTNVETNDPIRGASVNIENSIALTDGKGRYIIADMPFSENLNVIVVADNYEIYTTTLSLNQELLALDISLIPVVSKVEKILAVFEAFSRDIETLDSSKIPAIQSYFSVDYKTADDDATLFGVMLGVVPPDYDSIPKTITNIIEQYSRAQFRFDDPDIKFTGSLAVMRARFTVIAMSKPPDQREWEIVINGRFDLCCEDGKWKIVYWELIPPFIKVAENIL